MNPRAADVGRSSSGRDFDVIIVGAGVIGAAMASLCVAHKLAAPDRVAIVTEPVAAAVDAPTDWGLRVYALSRASQRLLEVCGIWTSLPADRLCAYERMQVWDSPAGAAPAAAAAHPLIFDCAELGEPNLGYIVEGNALHTQCQRAAAAAGVVVIQAGLTGVRVNAAGVLLSLRDGRELQARLLIGADGVESATRRLLGIESAGHSYHQDALVAHVRTSLPHRRTAWQRFLPGGPLAFLPMPDGRSSIVWSAARPEVARLRSLQAAAFGAALTAASDNVLGACELASAVTSFPLKLQYALEYARPHAVLVGDAAHAVHPLAGQGLNLGLLDCAALAQVLGSGSFESLGDYGALRRYERWRRSENLLAATAFDGLERLFSTDNALLAGLRGAALRAVGRLPLLRRRLAAQALGLKGDLPELLKRAPL